MLEKGDYVTTVVGSKETTRLEYGKIISNTTQPGQQHNGSEDSEELLIAIRTLDNKIIFAHQDDTVVGIHTQI